MAKLNDYSGFNQIFRDSALGIALSAGGLSTLLPNILEAVSETRDMATFNALNFFSVIYFIVPVLLYTSYWLVWGFGKYLIVKIPAHVLTEYENKSTALKNYKVKVLIFCTLKIAPIFFFVAYLESLSSLSFMFICGYYGALSIAQLGFVTRHIRHISSFFTEEERDKQIKLRTRAFRLNVLIFTLDMFIGLALAVFNEPWVVYQGAFYVYFASVIAAYSIVALSLHWAINRVEGISYDLIIVWLLIVCLGLCIPAVNLQGKSIISAIVFVTVVAYMMVFAWPLKSLTDYFKVLFPTVIFVTVYFSITSGYERINRSYLNNRIDAASEMPEDKIFPFYFFKINPVIPADSALELALKIDSLNHRSFSDPKNERKLQFITNETASTFNVRSVYYDTYDTLLKQNGTKKYKYFSQDEIDSIYDILVKQLHNNVFPVYFGPCKADPLMDKNYELREYGHPIDFYSRFLTDERNQRDTMRDIILLLEQIKRYRHVLAQVADTIKSKQLLYDYRTLISKYQKKLTTIQDIRNFTAKLEPDTAWLTNIIDSKNSSELNLFNKLIRKDSLQTRSMLVLASEILALQEQRYERVYKGAQKVYRSYLVDSQRIGVYIFLTSLIILALAWWFNNRDEEMDNIQEKENSFSVRQAFFIQTLSIFILLVPLVRPIKPENINPEKPYWMMTLQNWHAPNFTASHSYKHPPSSAISGTTPMLSLLSEIRDELQGTNKRIDSVYLDIRQLEDYDEIEGLPIQKLKKP